MISWCDAGQRQQYVNGLRDAYRTEVQECLRSNNIKSQADVVQDIRTHLLGLREECSLTQADATRTLEEELEVDIVVPDNAQFMGALGCSLSRKHRTM